MHTWVKLHLSLLGHDIMKDPSACHVFINFLLRADDKGRGTFSRFQTAKELGLNSNTFHSCTTRIAKKYDLITITRTTKFTKFQILNWIKYQSIGTTTDTNMTPSRHHPYRRARDGVRLDKKGIASPQKGNPNSTLPVEPCIDGLEQLRESMRMKGLRA